MKRDGIWFAAFGTVVALTIVGPSRARGVEVFFDDYQQFTTGAVLTETNYVVVSGPSSTEAEFIRESGAGTVTASNFQSSIWAFADVPNGGNHKYEGRLSSPRYDERMDISWTLRIESTNSGTGGFAVNVRFDAGDDKIWYNPIILFFDNGQINTFTNSPGSSDWISLGTWDQYAGTVMTNRLVLDYPANQFSYSINGIVLTNMSISSYFTNVFDAVRFQCLEMFPNSEGNRYAWDNVRVEAPSPDNLVVTSFSGNGELTWTYPTNGVTEYRVEGKGSLDSAGWTNDVVGITPTGATMSASLPLPGTRRFYRVVAVTAVPPPRVVSVPD